jgi:protein SDA1
MFNFYPFISKYINTHQKELPEILAMVAESTHINVPHEEVSPLIEKICDNFINERATPLNMTIALNAVREICARNPNAMNKEQLQYCIAYYKIKNKSVSIAIKGLINLFRDLRPDLLEKKQLGKEEAIKLRSEPVDAMVANTRLSTIDGIELLREHEGLDPSVNMMGYRLLTEQDFKLIKTLKLQKKAEEAKEKLKINLAEYDIVDQRFNHAEENDCGSCDGEGEFDADDESEEAEESEGVEEAKGHAAHSKNVRFKQNEEDDFEPEGHEEGDDHDHDHEHEHTHSHPVIKERSDGIKFVPTFEEDVEVDFSLDGSGSDSDDYVDSNPHNFLDGSLLNTFKKSKYEKMAETYVTREEKIKLKKQKAKDRHKKDGKSKTNKEKLKNKPISMVMPKKLKGIHSNYRSTKERIKELKTKLGKIKDGKLRVHRSGLKKIK